LGECAKLALRGVQETGRDEYGLPALRSASRPVQLPDMSSIGALSLSVFRASAWNSADGEVMAVLRRVNDRNFEDIQP
jgi:hypothetical protein